MKEKCIVQCVMIDIQEIERRGEKGNLMRTIVFPEFKNYTLNKVFPDLTFL